MFFLKKNKIGNIKKIITKLGYIVEEKEDDTLYLNRKDAPLSLLKIQEDQSIWIMGWWRVNQTGATNHYALLQYLNNLNWDSTITNFKYDKEDKTLVFHAAYIHKFDANNFYTFLKKWEEDVINMLNHNSQTNIFLGSDGIDSYQDIKISA